MDRTAQKLSHRTMDTAETGRAKYATTQGAQGGKGDDGFSPICGWLSRR